MHIILVAIATWIHCCMDQELPTAKRLHRCTAAEKASTMQWHARPYMNIAYTKRACMHFTKYNI